MGGNPGVSSSQHVRISDHLCVSPKAFLLFLAVRYPVIAQTTKGLTMPQNRYLPWADVIFATVIRFGSGNLENVSAVLDTAAILRSRVHL